MADRASSPTWHHAAVPRPTTVLGVAFDGDDTLWLTEELYDEARAAAREAVEDAGLDGAAWEDAQRVRDLTNVATLGHTIDRFPTSAVEALAAVVPEGFPGRDQLVARVRSAAASVFITQARLRPNAAQVLGDLRRRGLRLALITKGDEAVQRRRLEQSGLGPLFEIVKIVSHKTPSTFVAVANELGLGVADMISVGNSVESDIRPSIEAGVYAIWLPAYVWEFEHHDPAVEADLHRVDSLSAVLEFIGA